MAQRPTGDSDTLDDLRLDKWLWAARFFKTRGLAVEAIAGGKVLYNGARTKPAHVVRVGDEVRVRIGPYEHVVRVQALVGRRGPAKTAQLLYEETPESLATRHRLAEQLRAASLYNPQAGWSDSKKDRRDLRRMRGKE
jgi:ribosome-associated heat shock protein Hsp15